MKSTVWILVSLFALTFTQSIAAQPEIRKMAVTGDTLRILGSEFEGPCRKCEVIANFDKLRYSLQVISWSDTEVKAKLVDLGRGNRPAIELVTPGWRSKPVRVKIHERLLPGKRSKRFVSDKSKAGDLLHYSRRFESSLGGKGEEVFDISEKRPSCGQTAPIFDSAEILLGRRTRFGEAKITQMPRSGCENCKLKVVYYWEPTGRLHYQLHIYRRVVEGVCKAQVR